MASGNYLNKYAQCQAYSERFGKKCRKKATHNGYCHYHHSKGVASYASKVGSTLGKAVRRL